MISIDVKIGGLMQRFPALAAKRGEMMQAGVYALRVLVQKHLHRVAPRKHASAARLSAQPTGHIEKGLAAITASADATGGTVRIPIPGLRRARGPLTIVPRVASDLTVPVAAVAYGRRVAELRRMGWKIFRPKGKDVLMGSLNGSEAKSLYALKKRVPLRADPELLPTDAEMSTAVRAAMVDYVRRFVRGVA